MDGFSWNNYGFGPNPYGWELDEKITTDNDFAFMSGQSSPINFTIQTVDQNPTVMDLTRVDSLFAFPRNTDYLESIAETTQSTAGQSSQQIPLPIDELSSAPKFINREHKAEESVEHELIQEWNRRSTHKEVHIGLEDVPDKQPPTEQEAIAIAQYNTLIDIMVINPNLTKKEIRAQFAERTGLDRTHCDKHIKSLMSKAEARSDLAGLTRAMYRRVDDAKFFNELKHFDEVLRSDTQLIKSQIVDKILPNDPQNKYPFKKFLLKTRKLIERGEQLMCEGRSIQEIHDDFMRRDKFVRQPKTHASNSLPVTLIKNDLIDKENPALKPMSDRDQALPMEEFNNWYNNYGCGDFATDGLAFISGQSSSSSSSSSASSAPPINFPSQPIDCLRPQDHTVINLTNGDPFLCTSSGLDYIDTEESVAETSQDAANQFSQPTSPTINEESSTQQKIKQPIPLNIKQTLPIALETLQKYPTASKGKLVSIFNELSPPIIWNNLKNYLSKRRPIEGSIEYRLLQEWNNRRSDRHKGHLVLGDMPNGLSRAEEAKSVIVARANILLQIIEINADQKRAMILELFAERIGLKNSSCVAFIKNLKTLSKSDLGADWDRVNLAREMFLSLHIIKPDNDKFIEELKRFDRMLHLNPELNKTQITNEMTQNDSRKLAHFNIFLAKIRKKIAQNERLTCNGRLITEIHNDFMSRADS
jgi:uncharacterized tellurite resistance protein B-like protein